MYEYAVDSDGVGLCDEQRQNKTELKRILIRVTVIDVDAGAGRETDREAQIERVMK